MDIHPLEALCEIYLDQKNLSISTIKSYRIVYKKYIAYLKMRKIFYAKTSDVIQYRENRRSLGYSSHYLHVHISALRGLYHYLKQNQKRLNLPDLYAHNVMDQIRSENINYHLSKPILSLEQARHMIVHTKKMRTYIWHYRDHAIISLMITSGLRSIEVIHAKRKDYQTRDKKPVLYIKKQGRQKGMDKIDVSPGTAEAINDYLHLRKDDNPYLFVSYKRVSKDLYLSRTFFKDMFARLLKECGLTHTRITPHSLRHTAGIMNLVRGGSLEQTKALMRHVDIDSTKIYLDYLDRLKDNSEHEIESFILKEEANDVYIMLE